MARREPFTLKQKVLITMVGLALNMPAYIFVILEMNRFPPRFFALIGAINLGLGVPLLALISEKVIRKVR
ncbi:MAG: hypothetical protein WA414_12295 [Acidobacteriaceae bacterium]|jgi:hypothetical protein